MAKLLIAGFSHSKGIAKASGKPYSIARLLPLTAIFEWKNDNGRGIGCGYETSEQKAIPVDDSNTQLLGQLLELQYPNWYEVELSPNPEDPTKNIVTGIKAIPKATS